MVFCSIRKRISLTASSTEFPNNSNAPPAALTCSETGMQGKEVGLSSNRTGESSASFGTSVFSSPLQRRQYYISHDYKMDLLRIKCFLSWRQNLAKDLVPMRAQTTLYIVLKFFIEIFKPACSSATGPIVMCTGGFWRVQSLLHVVSEIQISFIQAHWHEVRVIVRKNLTNLTETYKLTCCEVWGNRKYLNVCVFILWPSPHH